MERLSAGTIAAVLRAGRGSPRQQKLQLRRERARAVPAAAAMKELLSAWAQRREHMLEVRCRSRHRTEGGRIERAAPGSEKSDGREPASDLEAAAADVPHAETGLRQGARRVQAAARASANQQARQPRHQSRHAAKRSCSVTTRSQSSASWRATVISRSPKHGSCCGFAKEPTSDRRHSAAPPLERPRRARTDSLRAVIWLTRAREYHNRCGSASVKPERARYCEADTTRRRLVAETRHAPWISPRARLHSAMWRARSSREVPGAAG
jgi:hypothetical protein